MTPNSQRQPPRSLQNDAPELIPAFINRIVLCELVWVLESAYGYSKDTVVTVLDRLFRTSQLQVEDAQTAWTAFRMYQNSKGGFCGLPFGINEPVQRL